MFDVTGRILLQRAAPPQVLGQVLRPAGVADVHRTGLRGVFVPALVELGGAPAALIGTAGAPARHRRRGGSAWRRRRRRDVPQVRVRLLRLVPVSRAAGTRLEGLARALEPLHVAAGRPSSARATPVTASMPSPRVIRVTKNGHDVQTLGRGDGFGEIALIEDVPRTATVTATTDAELFSLTKEPFILALTGHAPAARAASDMVSRRLGELEAL